ncbi:hypothetical protein, partial [Xylanibacter rodentium]
MFNINDISSLYLIRKDSLTRFLFYSGMTIAYFGSLNPWFMWALSSYYIIISTMFVTMAMFVSSTMQKPLFTRTDFIVPTVGYLLLVTYQ